MRLLITLATLGALGYGGYWAYENKPIVRAKVDMIIDMIHNTEFHTLEARFTPEQIMNVYRTLLLKDDKHRFQPATTKFAPYLMMEVKYINAQAETIESIILWDLIEGEMLLNTTQWEKTHGFADCILANIRKNEFRVINALAERGGTLDREHLARILQVENEQLGNWLEKCLRKKLIVQVGNSFRLHLQKPLLAFQPRTKIDERLVTKSLRSKDKIRRKFSDTQVRRVAESAFGPDFAVRKTLIVYLPIYCITVENPDGSVHTSHWNALTGKEISFTALLEQ
ncbi:MAG: hypothetical protein A3F09_06055 [Chlamydiae bacterium RIFCSPHIGHO2_12_FULL_49_11]|nr:MAG: hypothetical protein A3F09_06055 [Chlamydiae bacterium RIFCSPHIGHO2_12_FULL_49_11]